MLHASTIACNYIKLAFRQKVRLFKFHEGLKVRLFWKSVTNKKFIKKQCEIDMTKMNTTENMEIERMETSFIDVKKLTNVSFKLTWLDTAILNNFAVYWADCGLDTVNNFFMSFFVEPKHFNSNLLGAINGIAKRIDAKVTYKHFFVNAIQVWIKWSE